MSQNSYLDQTLIGATGVEMIVALYDASIRFLYRAVTAVEDGDVAARRDAVKRFVDVVMYLQARLRMDLGGDTATTLSDFYSAMFTLSLEASHEASAEKFHEVIANVKSVRDAWVIVARDPEAGRVLPRELRTREEKFVPRIESARAQSEPSASRWSA